MFISHEVEFEHYATYTVLQKKYTTQPPFVTLTVVVGLQLVTVDEVDVTLSV